MTIPFQWLLPPAAYLLGSVPFGLLLTRRFCGVDVRRQGSGNIGATNVRRVAGSRPALMTLAADVLKGYVPVLCALCLSDAGGADSHILVSMTALAAILGHMFPVYTGFRGGGKGVATTAGCFLCMSPMSLAVAVIVFVAAVGLTNRVSVGSLFAAVVLPVAVWIITGFAVYTGCAAIIAAGIAWRHWDNIQRLITGTEPRFRVGKDH